MVMDAICGCCENKEGLEVRKCGRCLSISYCSPNCQKVHWKVHKKDCCPFKTTLDPIFGKQLVATRDLKAGTVVMNERSILECCQWSGNNWSCLTCSLRLQGPQRRLCSNCGWPICSLDCEKDPLHATNECSVFSAQKTQFNPPALRSLVSGALRSMAKFRTTGSSPPPGVLEAIVEEEIIPCCILVIRGLLLRQRNPKAYHELMTEDYDRGSADSPKILTWVILRSLQLVNPSKMGIQIDDAEIKKFIAVSNSNNYIRHDCLKKRAPMLGVFLKSTRMSHSCSPNCHSIILPAPAMSHRVKTAIFVKKGDPLTLSYSSGIEVLGRPERRKRLMEESKWKFLCHCQRCLDPTEQGTFMDGVTCPKCRPNGTLSTTNGHDPHHDDNDGNDLGYFLSTNPLDLGEGAEWRCNGCQSSKSFAAVSKMIEKPQEELSKAQLEAKENVNYGPLENLIENYQDGRILHPNHHLINSAAREWVKLMEAHQLALKLIGCGDDEDGDDGSLTWSRADFTKMKGRREYLLAIEDKLTLGISEIRGRSLEGLSKLILKAFEESKPDEFSREERLDLLRSALSQNEEAALYFNHDPLCQDTANSLLTMHHQIKKALASF